MVVRRGLSPRFFAATLTRMRSLARGQGTPADRERDRRAIEKTGGPPDGEDALQLTRGGCPPGLLDPSTIRGRGARGPAGRRPPSPANRRPGPG